jgi:hypothetical protein
MAANSLQAMLDRAKAQEETAQPKAKPVATKAAPRAARKTPTEPIAGAQPSRSGTKLIGGHFAPKVSTQLRIIAAEEGTTIQSLLAEALDDLFVKKGKARILKR